ncbi:MAG: NAD-dependent epimerase/dehydratase family protein [Bacillota bacterium]|nr:NAD-dependent epimerase/dehydratase family protein [Bacillota bacterium]
MHRILEEDIDNIIKAELTWEKFQGTNVLITGASGMIGSYIMNTLIALKKKKQMDINIYVLVRNPAKLDEEVKDYVKVIQQSVVDPINTDIEFDFVIHTASPASPLIMKNDPVGTVAANTIGTYNTLNVAQKGSGKGYLYISSREIYGQPYENQEIFTENTYGFVDPLNVRSCYPEGKKAAETMCVCFKEQYGINTKIARLAHTFGPGMPVDDGRVQADFLRNVINNEDIVLKSEGVAVRTYTYVGDAVLALFYILLDSEEMVYNISSEESTVSIKQLAETLVDAYPERNLKLVFDIPESEGNTGCAPFTLGILSSDRIRKLGWEPIYGLKEGLMRTVEYLEGEQ